MEVRLFKIGSHEYVFRMGLVRKGTDDTTDKYRNSHRKFSKKSVLEVPANKYGYNREDVSKNIGLKNYIAIMQKMPDILNFIPEEPTDTSFVVAQLVKNKVVDISVSVLNNITRIHESNPLEDAFHKKWLLINSGWGVNSKISKKEVDQ